MKRIFGFQWIVFGILIYLNTCLLFGQPVPVQPDSNLTIMAVGDVMMGTAYPDNGIYLPPHHGKQLFAAVADTLKSADLTFCNLEGPLVDGGTPAKECKNPANCYIFRTPTRYIQNLVAAGFDLASVANNHARDFGMAGFQSTARVLDSVGIAHSGKIGDVASLKVKNKKIAMIAFAPYDGLNDLLNLTRAEGRIRLLKQEFDLVIVSFHGGAEGGRYLHVPDSMEVYFGEKRGYLRQFAHRVIDAGADLVLGHGPHVPRALEIYKKRLIAYSLGNFCTYGKFNLKGSNGLTYILAVNLKSDGQFQSGQIIPGLQIEPGIPKIDPTGQVIQLIKRLSNADFPKTAPIIDDSGKITAPGGEVFTEAAN